MHVRAEGTPPIVDARVVKKLVDRKTDVKTADVLEELDASHRAFIAAAAALPDAQLAPGGAARDPFEGAGAGHYREHTAQINEWRRNAGA